MRSHEFMNQIDQLREAFSKPSDEKSPVWISAQSDTVQIRAQVVDCDRLGYLLTALEAQCIDEDRAAETDNARVEEGIKTLVEEISYLTEPLTLVEKAADLSRVSLRSAQPDRREDGIYYYDLTLEGEKSIHLVRWHYDFETHRRTVVPFALSKDVFERLVDDFGKFFHEAEEPAIELPTSFKTPPSTWEAEY